VNKFIHVSSIVFFCVGCLTLLTAIIATVFVTAPDRVAALQVAMFGSLFLIVGSGVVRLGMYPDA